MVLVGFWSGEFVYVCGGCFGVFVVGVGFAWFSWLIRVCVGLV